MKIIEINKHTVEEIVKQACQILDKGGLVIYPTETCYGLGADATNPKAICRLLEYKRRREGKPLSILVADQKQAEKYVDLNHSARNLYQRFLPGPMTVISKTKPGKLALGVASELGTVGIRISSHPVAMALAKAYPKPITATSANASWNRKPYSVDDIVSPLTEIQKSKLDLILEAGQLPKREASTVVDTTLAESMVLRQGEIDLGLTTLELTSTSEAETQQLAQTLMLKYWNQIRTSGLVFGLAGDLGVGKTIFAKGIGTFLGIEETITSPSYSLVDEHPYIRHEVKGLFYHFDPWRLDSFSYLKQLGLRDMMGSNKIVLIEWANKFKTELEAFVQQLAVPFVYLTFEELGPQSRKIRVYE